MLGPQAPLEAPPVSALPPSSLWTAPCAHQSVSLQRMEGTMSLGKWQLWDFCALPCPSVDFRPSPGPVSLRGELSIVGC